MADPASSARARRLVVLLSSASLWLVAGPAAAATDGPYTPPHCHRITYHSAPGLHAQRLCMNLGVSTHGTAPATFLFLTPGGIAEKGAGIYRDNGQLVWWHPGHGSANFNLTVVRYRGQSYLGLWSGQGVPTQYQKGKVTLYDEHYRKAGVITAGGRFASDQIDPHEFRLTPDGDALIGFDDPVRRRIRGAWTTVLQYVVQKLALVTDRSGIHTGRVLFQWKSLPSVPVSESYFPDPGQGGTWDYFHGNSIAQDADGNLIVSARNTWGIYKINVKSGRMMWQVGAKGDPGLPTRWCYQHDAEPLGHDRYSVFDDGGSYFGCAPVGPGHPARGIVISVKTHGSAVSVRRVRAYQHVPPIHASCCGGVQPLPDGHSLVDWGSTPEVTEYDAAGRVDMDLSLTNWSYRAYRFPWVGDPLTRPAVAGRRQAGRTRLWASWNGSTEVAAWQVLAGPSPNHLAPVGRAVPSAGFETAISLSASRRYVAVRALAHGGRILARSRTVATTS